MDSSSSSSSWATITNIRASTFIPPTVSDERETMGTELLLPVDGKAERKADRRVTTVLKNYLSPALIGK